MSNHKNKNSSHNKLLPTLVWRSLYPGENSLIILVVNCGSSSLKYTLFQDQQEMGSGLIEKIGSKSAVFSRVCHTKNQSTIKLEINNHEQAIKLMMTNLIKDQLIVSKQAIDAVGHRVAHGGPDYKDAAMVNKKVVANKIGRTLAPLHQVNYTGMEVILKMLPKVPQVAVFDTAFHQSIAAKAFTYALPYQLANKHNIRKYGFHGSSHKYVTRRAAKLLKKTMAQTNIITLHLGNGSSMAAVKKGCCVDTSMGLTPLSGLVMGTRCGDIDPAIVTLLMEKEGFDVNQVDDILNKKSGVFGLSGVSNDMREIISKAKLGHKQAQLAIDVFVYTIQKYIGAYHAVIGGAEAIIFTAGIGERSAVLRKLICENLSGIGIKLDLKKNLQTIAKEGFIHARDSKIKIAVIPTNEELMIAQETIRIVRQNKD